jgi:hypothetical protein
MKKIITSLGIFLAFAIAAQAQPVIVDGTSMPPVGYSDSIAMITSAMSPGTGGANITWDFSSLAPVVGGMAKVVDPATTPYASTFPTANYVIELTPNGVPGSMYEYYNITNTKWEILGSNYSITTPGGDYTPNPKTMMPFPFSFNQSETDAFQKVGSSASSVTITYDGFGTLITPYRINSNVIRIKRDFGGTDFYYDWFTLNPLITVATYDNNEQKFTFLSTSTVNSINDIRSRATSSVYPNPVISRATITLASGVNTSNAATAVITDVTGRIVRLLPVESQAVAFDRAELNGGLYFYSIRDKGTIVSAGKFVIQ